MNEKTEIEIELSETVAYSDRFVSISADCPICRCVVEMTTPKIAAALAKSNEREIFRLIEAAKIHFIDSGSILVCLPSLFLSKGET